MRATRVAHCLPTDDLNIIRGRDEDGCFTANTYYHQSALSMTWWGRRPEAGTCWPDHRLSSLQIYMKLDTFDMLSLTALLYFMESFISPDPLMAEGDDDHVSKQIRKLNGFRIIFFRKFCICKTRQKETF